MGRINLIWLLISSLVQAYKDVQHCNGTLHTYCVSYSSSKCSQLFGDTYYEYISYLKFQDKNCSTYLIADYEITVTDLLIFNNSDAVNIVGTNTTDQQVKVKCTENGGFLFLNCNSTHLENLNMVRCSFNISNFIQSPSLSSYKSSIVFQSVAFIWMLKCTIEDHVGYATLFVDILNTAIIEDCVFNGNKSLISSIESRSGGIVLRQSQNLKKFHIQSCTFTEVIDTSTTHNISNTDDILLQHGGALDMHFTTGADNEEFILISDSNFSQNKALIGAAIHVLLIGDISDKHKIIISHSNFSHNSASTSGGAVQLTNLQNGESATPVFQVVSSVFKDNSASWGGGLAIMVYNNSCHFKIIMEGSTWENNKATTSGFAVGIRGSVSHQTTPSLSSYVSNCVFHSNIATRKVGTGAVAVNFSEIVFDGGITIFSESNGTALFLNGFSIAKFFAKVTFSKNSGILGGAILLQFHSHIFIHSSSSIQFINNSASIMGGAIYSMVTGTSSCTFLFEEDVSTATINVSFYNNHVNQTQQSLFIQNSEGCINFKDILISGFKYFPVMSNNVFLPLKEVKFSTLTSSGRDGNTHIMPGEPFHLEVIEIQDFFGLKTNYCNNYVWITFMNVNDFSVTGPSTISLNTTSSKATFHVEGPNIDKKTNISFDVYFFFYGTDTYRIGRTKIALEVVPCRLGYTFSDKTKSCNCASTKSNKLICPTDSQHLCVKYRYWYSNELNLAIPCPAQNCWYMYNQCPKPTTYCLNKSELFCGITHPDDLCWDGRSGLLCSQCAAGYSFTFAAFQCANNTSCKSTNTALMMSAVLIYWISYVGIILVVLSMNISIGSGFMYGIVYYFSVVSIYINSNPLFSDLWLRIIVYMCIAITQLNPQLLGYAFRICFIQNWDTPLPHELFHYTTPLFVVIFIVGIIKISQHCRLPKRIALSENSPIHAICMLILFSYTSLSLTSLNIIMPMKIDRNLMVRLAPTVSYFSTAHVPYAVIALCTEVLLALPICIFLLFAPCISKHVNLVRFKLKPILDEFQACYRPECRCFAGFYFLARQLVYIVDGLLIENIPQYNSVLLTLNILILILHVSFQPYQKKWINILDTFLLIDILLLSMYSTPLPSDQILPVNRTFYNTVIPCILILLPTMYLFGTLAFILFQQLKCCLFKCRFNTLARLVLKTNNSNYTDDFPVHEDEWQRDQHTPLPNNANQGRKSISNNINSVMQGKQGMPTYGTLDSEQSQPSNVIDDLKESNMRRFPPT